MQSESGSPPRILHVTEAMGGGVASALFDYVRHTPELEHHLLYASRPETEALTEDWRELFHSAEELPAGQLRRTSRVRSRIKELKPDVLHSHSSFAGMYARLAALKSRRFSQVYTPHCYAFERLDLHTPVRLVLRMIEWTLSFNTTAIAACSPREVSLAKHWLFPARARYLPNVAPETPWGVAFEDSALLRTEVVRVAGAGRLSAQKDPDYFISAIQALQKAGYQVAASWIGGGERALVDRLEQADITVTGWLPRDEAFRALAGQDIYLHTAAWEGFPLAVLEAGALRLTTVVRDIPAFEGLDFPLKINKSTELIELWGSLSDPCYRRETIAKTQFALRSNTPQAQRAALLEIYSDNKSRR